MEEKTLKNKSLTKILLSILLVLCSIAVIIIAFVGIYVPKSNKLKDVIPDYKLGTEIDGIIEYRLFPDNSEEEKEVYVDSKGAVRGIVSDGHDTSSTDDSVEVTTDLEETVVEDDTGFAKETRTIRKNEESSLTVENFEKSKKILESRLENAGATEYAIRLDKDTGNIVVELSQNDDVAYLYQVALSAYGEFDIIDYQTGVVLMDKTHLKQAGVVTNLDQTAGTYTIYLQLELDEDGRNIIKEISKQYIEYTDSEGNSQKDKISLRVDGSSIMTTYFGEEYDNAILNIPISQGVKAEDLTNYAKSVEDVAYILNNETIPVKYTENGGALFIDATISNDIMKIVNWTILGILAIFTVCLFAKFGPRGFLAGIMNACLIGLVIIVVKYTKVVISVSSIVALFGVVALNIIFIIKYLRKLKADVESPYANTLKEFYSIFFPIVIVSFVYTFFVSATVTGLGSVLFWGMLLQFVYNTVIVRYVLEGK